MSRRRHVVALAVWAAVSLLPLLGGCGAVGRYDLDNEYTSPARVDKGAVVILPGIEGESAANRDIRKGLYDAGIPYALVIYRWGSLLPGPGGMFINQTNVGRNRKMGKELAEQIAQ